MSTSVLVTGGAGYIGSTMVRNLLAAGCRVTVLDRFVYKNECSLKDLDGRIEVVEGDVRDQALVRKLMEGVSCVVHLAEIVGDPACAENPELARSINGEGACNVARIAKEQGIRKFIYTSSCSVYGLSAKENLLSETSELNPLSLYAQLKVEVEDYLREIADDDFQPVILRLSTVYGLSYRPRFDLVVNVVTARATIDNEIVIKGDADWRPLVHVYDVARVVCRLLAEPDSRLVTVNVGHESQNHRLLEIGELAKSIVPEATLTVLPQNEADRRSYRGDFSLLQRMLAFQPDYDVRRGMNELRDYVLKNRDYKRERFSNVAALASAGGKI